MVVSKFEGTALDWFRFWNQFETEIDQQGHISPVTKYSYLKEFLLPRVRNLVDSLPFTFEGYSSAKAIFHVKFGKPTVLANAHINCITVVFGSHPNKVHDFYEKLMSSVKALETMTKYRDRNDNVRSTLDKLHDIYVTYLRLYDIWQDWNLLVVELVEALRYWTEINPKIIISDKNVKRDNVYHTKERTKNALLNLLQKGGA